MVFCFDRGLPYFESLNWIENNWEDLKHSIITVGGEQVLRLVLSRAELGRFTGFWCVCYPDWRLSETV
jgi:hypothetical protein